MVSFYLLSMHSFSANCKYSSEQVDGFLHIYNPLYIYTAPKKYYALSENLQHKI